MFCLRKYSVCCLVKTVSGKVEKNKIKHSTHFKKDFYNIWENWNLPIFTWHWEMFKSLEICSSNCPLWSCLVPLRQLAQRQLLTHVFGTCSICSEKPCTEASCRRSTESVCLCVCICVWGSYVYPLLFFTLWTSLLPQQMAYLLMHTTEIKDIVLECHFFVTI